jgi:hypothetical protein
VKSRDNTVPTAVPVKIWQTKKKIQTVSFLDYGTLEVSYGNYYNFRKTLCLPATFEVLTTVLLKIQVF